MTTHKFSRLLAGAAFAGSIVWAGVALAQTTSTAPRPAAAAPRPAASTAARPSAAAIPQGPPIPGMCVFSAQAAIVDSAVGKAYLQRLQQLGTQVNAELTADQNAIRTDAQTLDTQKATLGQDVYDQRRLALQQRVTALQRKAELRQREMDATDQKAQARVISEMQPLVGQVYAQRNCSTLMDGQVVLISNPAMNITEDVVKLLNGKITTFPFDREHLDQTQTAAATPGAAQPRTQ
jgi:Skp family chaperone for outer membrane proteins